MTEAEGVMLCDHSLQVENHLDQVITNGLAFSEQLLCRRRHISIVDRTLTRV